MNVAFVVLLVHLSISRRSLKQAMQPPLVCPCVSSGASGNLRVGLGQRSVAPHLEEKLGFMFRNQFASICM